MGEPESLTLYERLGSALPAAEGIRPGGLKLTERALSFCRFSPGAAILDIGCGCGATVNHLNSVHGFRVIGVDSSAVQLREARRKTPSISVIRASATDLPFAGKRFDGAVLECVLSLTENHRAVLDECNRVLKPGGRIILSDLCAGNTQCISRLRDLPVNCCLRGAMGLDDLAAIVVSAGFQIETMEDHSDYLKEFAVRMIWKFGSMAGFWSLAGGQSVDHEEICRSISESRPGYCLIIGRKLANR